MSSERDANYSVLIGRFSQMNTWNLKIKGRSCVLLLLWIEKRLEVCYDCKIESSALVLKVGKKCQDNPRKFYFTYVSKNAEFDAHFESVKKVAKNFMRKKLSTKNWQKMQFWLVLLCAKIFWPTTFYDFLHFFQRIRTQHHILHFMIPISKFWRTFFGLTN